MYGYLGADDYQGMSVTSTSIGVYLGSSYSNNLVGSSMYLIIEYTKTTD